MSLRNVNGVIYHDVVYVDFNMHELVTVVDWPNEEKPEVGDEVFAMTTDDTIPFGCLATISDVRLVARGEKSTEWLLTLDEVPTIIKILQESREERDDYLASLCSWPSAKATHEKVSSFGDDTCSCGYDGWPCGRTET